MERCLEASNPDTREILFQAVEDEPLLYELLYDPYGNYGKPNL